ncbi:DNA-binding protein [Methylobacterium oryzae]|uniref:DNA-binding protein n=1 Tax=Methylobacterium oryzae TaxID=334852 RepID=UPI002F3225DD
MKEIATRPSSANDTGLSDDPVIVGAENIAKVIYGEVEGQREGNIRRIYHAISKRELPTFSLGGRVHARRSTIMRWIEQQESAA